MRPPNMIAVGISVTKTNRNMWEHFCDFKKGGACMFKKKSQGYAGYEGFQTLFVTWSPTGVLFSISMSSATIPLPTNTSMNMSKRRGSPALNCCAAQNGAVSSTSRLAKKKDIAPPGIAVVVGGGALYSCYDYFCWCNIPLVEDMLLLTKLESFTIFMH